MIYTFRFRTVYKTMADNNIFGIRASGRNLDEAQEYAKNLANHCEFISEETRHSMVMDILMTSPTTGNAELIM